VGGVRCVYGCDESKVRVKYGKYDGIERVLRMKPQTKEQYNKKGTEHEQ
jgi:hypothetical protein